ncbi:MAG: endonuclease/exonuclease/phosphatase family protein [Mariniphaga sp.]
MRKLIKYLLLILNLVAVAALLMAYMAGFVSPEKWWIPSFFGLAYPVIAGINVVFIVVWLITSPRYMLVSLIPLIAGWGYLTRYLQLQEKTTESGDIKIMSYNVHHFRGEEVESQQRTSKEIIRFLNEHKPDIICLQEVRLRQNRIFNLAKTVEELEFINHYQFARTSNTFGSVTMSRYPVVRMHEIRFENSRNITIYTDLLIDTDTVRVFNVHLHSYGINPQDFGIIDSGVTSEKDLEEARVMGSKLKAGFQMRASQVQAIRALIDDSPYPVIVCGDLNDTPASFSYQQIRKGLNDAFVSSGKGAGRTYINKLPALRIDYIFHSDQYESYNFQTHDFRYSDHLPVSAVLVKKPPQE